MREKNITLEDLGDAALAELARSSNTAAFAELWRRHVDAGTAAARQFASIADPQDLVSEAYVRILRALQQGGGPHEAFRPYLYRTIRNIALDWRSRHPSVSLDETGDLVEHGPSMESVVLENTVIAAAFDGLPERWQAVLWYLEVEGMSPTEAGPLLGLSPNSTSALAARANEGFKAAWLQAHVNDRSVPAECRWTTERMGRYVRHSLSRRARARFDSHLGDCRRCALLVREVDEAGGQLATVLLPIALGASAGSLLLGHARDQAAMAAPALATIGAPTGAAVVSGVAAIVLVVSGVLSSSSPAVNENPPAAQGSESSESAPASPAPETESDPAVHEEPEVPPAESTPVSGVPVSALPVAVSDEPVPGEPVPGEPAVATPAPAPPEEAPIVDLSISLLGGSVEVDAVVDLDPSTGLLVEVVPGLHLLNW